MSLKFSPGPWEAVDRLTVRSRFVAGDADSGGWLVASLPAHASEDDARLIAAAPELLAALTDVIGWIPMGEAWHTDAAEQAVKRAREAIDKAAGGAA